YYVGRISMPYHDYEYQQDTTDIRKDTTFFTPENNAKKLLPHRLSLVLSAPTMWAGIINAVEAIVRLPSGQSKW
ncbi:hypothetical protein, partial [Escherichia coli]|uniref:hypothetical protein n=3 Tax=Escherichia coli TaxID=562 RepID=UPI0021E8260A